MSNSKCQIPNFQLLRRARKSQMPKFLYINTAIDNMLELVLIDYQGIILDKISKTIGIKQSEKLLPLIMLFLKKHNFLFKDLSGLAVVKGPGRFTSLRIGIATANTMSFALRIPVIGIELPKDFKNINFSKFIKSRKKRGYVRPMYGQEPNITKPKK